jgi:hypothetical protein
MPWRNLSTRESTRYLIECRIDQVRLRSRSVPEVIEIKSYCSDSILSVGSAHPTFWLLLTLNFYISKSEIVTIPNGIVSISNLYPSNNPIPINAPEVAAFTSTIFLEPFQITSTA